MFTETTGGKRTLPDTKPISESELPLEPSNLNEIASTIIFVESVADIIAHDMPNVEEDINFAFPNQLAWALRIKIQEEGITVPVPLKNKSGENVDESGLSAKVFIFLNQVSNPLELEALNLQFTAYLTYLREYLMEFYNQKIDPLATQEILTNKTKKKALVLNLSREAYEKEKSALIATRRRLFIAHIAKLIIESKLKNLRMSEV